jgi:hypothetical protein
VSSILPSLVAFGQIALALKDRHSVTSLAHTCSSPIAPSDLAGDFTDASARHHAVDRPPQASTGQIDPTSMTPYPRPCLATTSPSQNRTPDGEPPRDSTGGRTQPAPSLPRHRQSPPSSGMWAHATALSPHRLPRWWAEWAACPRGHARPRLTRPNPPCWVYASSPKVF